MSPLTTERVPSRKALVAAFLVVYVVWGSTYLGIRFAVETLPPLASAGVRFIVAGAVLYVVSRLRGAPKPDLARWGKDGLIGLLFLVLGNGPVVWAAPRVASGLAALLVSTTPIWMVMFQAFEEKRAPSPKVAVGLLFGLAGVGLLVGGGGGQSAGTVDVLAAIVLVSASVSWSIGSMLSRRWPAESTLLSTGMQMLTGGALMLVLGWARGELDGFALAQVSLRSFLALLYLCSFGSIIGYTAYTYLLRHASPTAASTYAYVNPIVAVGLGAMFAGEPVTARMAVAGLVILAAVFAMTTTSMRR